MTRITNHHQPRNLPFIVLLLLALSVTTLAHVATGVRNSTGVLRLTAAQLQQVQTSLRQKSGFAELGFDAQGVLTLGNREHLEGGSVTARALLMAAVDGTNRYELENHEHSPDVAFARLWAGEIYETADQRMDIYQLQLDFADFNWLSGPREARESYDMGINVLHELAHGVLQLRDPKGAMDQIGDCDAHINQMRRELSLPERLYYHPDIRVIQLANGMGVVQAKLQFVARLEGKPSMTYQLSWLASKVSPQAKNIAELEKGLAVAKRR